MCVSNHGRSIRVIASEAKQSIARQKRTDGLLRRYRSSQ